MGKGTIVNHIADGKYNVTINRDRTRAEGSIAYLQAKLVDLDANQLVALNNKMVLLNYKYTVKKHDLDTAIANWKAGLISLDDLRKVVVQVNTAMGLWQAAVRIYNSGLAVRNSIEARIQYLQNNTVADSTVEAWCADLTTDLAPATEVGTIEVPNELTHDLIIRPGHGGAGAYDQARDGQLRNVASITPAGVYFNYAVFPGWQKWKPTYRIGTLTWVNGNLCNLTLDAAASSVSALDVNAQTNYTNVPIVYMTCNGDPFEVGDRVVVEFIDQDYTNPRVIGFEANPKGCDKDLFIWTDNITPLEGHLFRYQGVSCTIDSHHLPVGSPLVLVTTNPFGLTFDWNNNCLIFGDFTNRRVHVTQDVDVGNYWGVTGTFFTTPNYLDCLAFDGTDLWSASYLINPVGGTTVRKYNGISGTIVWSKNLSNIRIQSLTYIGSGLFAAGCWDSTRSPQACIKIYNNAFTLQNEFTWPPGAVDGPSWTSSGPVGLTIKPNGDLISWGGRKQQIPAIYNYITVHDGVSATIKAQYACTITNSVDLLVYPDTAP